MRSRNGSINIRTRPISTTPASSIPTIWSRRSRAMSQPSIFWWQRFGTLAQMAQAAVALLGFVAVLFQINEIRFSNRAASARQVFLGYTDLAFKNPKFAAPDYEAIKVSGHDTQIQYE